MVTLARSLKLLSASELANVVVAPAAHLNLASVLWCEFVFCGIKLRLHRLFAVKKVVDEEEEEALLVGGDQPCRV